MKALALLAPLILGALTGPALAQSLQPEPRPMWIFRDSDGIVISILDPIEGFPVVSIGGGLNGGEVMYTLGSAGGGPSTGTDAGGLTATPRTGGAEGVASVTGGGAGLVISGAELLAASTSGRVIALGGANYLVEQVGGKLWLRDTATGERLAATRLTPPPAPDALGLTVNPQGFALE